MNSPRLRVRPAFFPVGLAVALGVGFIGFNASTGARADAERPAVLAARQAPPAQPARPAQPAPPSARPASVTPKSSPKPAAAPIQKPAAPRLSWSPGQEAWVSIPAIGLDLPVFPGGQATIDLGVVAHFSGPGWLPPVAAGQPGTYWLAAHHVTHGAPFLNLPGVRPGDLVVVTPRSGPAIRYQITFSQVVGTTATYATVYGTDTTTSRLLLQTCEGSNQRLLVHGVRV